MPTKFRDLDSALGRALLKLDSVAAVPITDDELLALNEHFATPGTPDLPLPVNVEAPVADKKASVGVCVETNPSTIGEEEVAALLAGFVKHNGGGPGQCSAKQRQQLKDLAIQHGRNKFRGAALAGLKDQPWDARTTHPFVAFINGFEGYAAVKTYKDSEQTRREAQEANYAFTTERVRWTHALTYHVHAAKMPSDQDRAVIKQMQEAKREEEFATPEVRDAVWDRLMAAGKSPYYRKEEID